MLGGGILRRLRIRGPDAILQALLLSQLGQPKDFSAVARKTTEVTQDGRPRHPQKPSNPCKEAKRQAEIQKNRKDESKIKQY